MRLRALALACVAAWVGIVAFFSFVVAPLVFGTVDRAVAGAAVSAVLPHYYRWGMTLAAVALAAYVLVAVRGAGGRHTAGVAALLCATMVATLAWAWLVVLPGAEAARRAHGDTAFALAHRRAIQLNGVTLAAGLAVLALEALRRDRRRDR